MSPAPDLITIRAKTALWTSTQGRLLQGAHLETTMQKNSIEVGRFLVSPFIKTSDDGGFYASVSISSGQGSANHDRVMRFTPRFTGRHQALSYARAQGQAWVAAQG